MRYCLVPILFTLSLAACQSGGGGVLDTSSSKKVGEASVEGGLFSSIFRSRQTRAILLPPDLVSSASDKVRANHEQASSDEVVLPEVTGAEIVNENGKRWLRVDTGPQAVWDKLVEFWADEQVDLVERKPAAGLMETDWIENLKLSGTDQRQSIVRLFDRITGAGISFDKFRIRLERESELGTRVYVTHRATERKESRFSPQKITQWEWVEKDSDEEKVAQLLQVMVLLFRGTT